MTRNRINTFLFCLVLALLFAGVGWHANNLYHRRPDINSKYIHLNDFKFISPLIDVELPAGYDVRNEPFLLKDKIEKFAKEQTGSGQVHEVSIYFRDLLDGPWFEINGNLTYNPASMMKVPIMVAWLKRAEKDPQVLLRKLTFDEKNYHGPPQGFKPAKFLHSDTAYTVEELLQYMMWYSDNRALWVLEKSLNPGEYDTILHNMGVPNEQDGEGLDIVTAHSYSGFFRILFNASFLNKEMSEKALMLLSCDEFPGGMAAGIPKGIKLASKFGEYSDRTKSNFGQLHEFGIVYHPKGPYILGILTRGTNIDKQLYFIKTASRIVYDSVSNN